MSVPDSSVRTVAPDASTTVASIFADTSTFAFLNRQKYTVAVSSCPSPLGLKYVLTHDGTDSSGGVLASLLIVTETPDPHQEAATPNSSFQLAPSTIPFPPPPHDDVSNEPLKAPS